MIIPSGYTQITPTAIQSCNTTTPNGVATTFLVLGNDGNLYFTQFEVPGLNPSNLTIQPWKRLAPILVPDMNVDYPLPSPLENGNVINVPYAPFKTQGQ